MATRQPAAGAAEVSEREYQGTLNAAVAATEDEVFRDALGDSELDNDGDTSLEEMGDGLEGDAEQEATEGEDGEEAETADGDADGEAEEQPRDQRGDVRGREPSVPPSRLREERQRATQAEDRAARLERDLAEMNGRMAEISARLNTAPQPKAAIVEAPPKPDMFAEPEKYEAWLMGEAERRADAKAEQRFGSFQQQQQQREAQRVDQSLADAARGERAFEFGAAYNALTALNPRDPKAQATVRNIYNAPDPAKALFDWWDQNGGDEYREQVFTQLAPRLQQRQQRQASPQGRQQPRHEIRPAQRLPSLNGASGSNSQRTADPEMMDGSERSVFDYGTRR